MLVNDCNDIQRASFFVGGFQIRCGCSESHTHRARVVIIASRIAWYWRPWPWWCCQSCIMQFLMHCSADHRQLGLKKGEESVEHCSPINMADQNERSLDKAQSAHYFARQVCEKPAFLGCKRVSFLLDWSFYSEKSIWKYQPIRIWIPRTSYILYSTVHLLLVHCMYAISFESREIKTCPFQYSTV